jgi:hypothetical protein
MKLGHIHDRQAGIPAVLPYQGTAVPGYILPTPLVRGWRPYFFHFRQPRARYLESSGQAN